MSPFLANLMVGAILALVGWAIAFGIYVVKQDRAREREISQLREKMAGLESKFVTQTAWQDFNRNFDTWKDKVLERIGHLGEQIAALTGKPSQ